MSAVHDGGESPKSGAAADGTHARGIAVHAVKTVSTTQGWVCTQAAPEQAHEAGSVPGAALQPQDSQQSACPSCEVSSHQSHEDPPNERGTTAQQREAGQPEGQTRSHGFSAQAVRTKQPQADAASAASKVKDAGQRLEAGVPSEPAAAAPEVSFCHLAAMPHSWGCSSAIVLYLAYVLSRQGAQDSCVIRWAFES